MLRSTDRRAFEVDICCLVRSSEMFKPVIRFMLL